MTDYKTLINPNLGVLCQEMQEHILEGWRIKEGYPIVIGWTYHADMEKTITTAEAPKQAGRPPKVTK